MLFGKGLSEGTQSSLRFLPERQTDFIFATLAEKLGFFGSVVILIAFAWLFWRIFTIIQGEKSRFGKIVGIALFFFLLLQFFTNVGMNVGIMPITGVTLPFVSYGGSSLLATFIMLGILSSMSSEQKSKGVLEIR
jgi:rod shape determining protein RodA